MSLFRILRMIWKAEFDDPDERYVWCGLVLFGWAFMEAEHKKTMSNFLESLIKVKQPALILIDGGKKEEPLKPGPYDPDPSKFKI